MQKLLVVLGPVSSVAASASTEADGTSAIGASRLEADGRLSALCLANRGTGETFLVVQKP